MAEKIIKLACGITISVDPEGAAYGFLAGDVITADESHAKWYNERVVVEGFAGGAQGKPKVIWARVEGEKICDCAHNPEGLRLLERSVVVCNGVWMNDLPVPA